MNKSFQFLIIFLVSFAGWWGVNLLNQDLEGLFYWHELRQNPEILMAKVRIDPEIKEIISQKINQPQVQALDIKAEAAVSVLITPEGKRVVLYEKNMSEKRPIASLTKLMTALVASETYNSSDVFRITKEAVDQDDLRGDLHTGEVLSLKELLHSMLIESSNDAAWAIAEGDSFNISEFVGLMNEKARKMNLLNTNFVNPTGLDGGNNYSTCNDLTRLVSYLIENNPQILEITKKKSYQVLNPDGSLHHTSENTNLLLGEFPEIIGGKTGFTDEAGGCVLLVLEDEDGNHLIHIVLGTDSRESRFEEMRKLVNSFK